jgi:hypothetical protein
MKTFSQVSGIAVALGVYLLSAQNPALATTMGIGHSSGNDHHSNGNKGPSGPSSKPKFNFKWEPKDPYPKKDFGWKDEYVRSFSFHKDKHDKKHKKQKWAEWKKKRHHRHHHHHDKPEPPAPVPIPGVLPVMAALLGASGMVFRRRRSARAGAPVTVSA